MSHIFQRLSIAICLAVMAMFAGPAAVQAKGNCGGIAGLKCPRGQYCQFGTGQCRIPDMMGVCRVRPQVCTYDYRPVCGCNGKTYGNACAAAAAGVSVLQNGPCGDDSDGPVIDRPGAGKAPPKIRRPQVCGGITGLRCRLGEYCAFRVGVCGLGDAQGYCKRRPHGCTREYRPVCGCNGKTYPNACVAAAAGMNIRRMGKCREDVRPVPRLRRPE